MQDYIDRKIDINARIDQITVKQFDNDSRYLHVTITDADLPDDGGSKKFNLTNCTAALYIQPAGDESGENVAFVAGEVADAEEGIVTFLLPGSVTQAVGEYECEIWMYEGSSSNRPIISGKPFTMTVEKSIRNTSAIMASSQYSALDAAMADAQSIKSEMTALIASPAGSGGDVGTELRNIRIGWDGYEYDSAGDAVRDQVRDLRGSVNEKMMMGKNVFNPDNVLVNCTLNTTTGVLEQTSDGSMVSGVIRTHGAEKVIISYLASNGTQALQAFRVCQYRYDNTFLSIATASTVNLSAECAYIRFYASSAFAAKRQNIMVELTNAGTNIFSPFERCRTRLSGDIVTALPVSSIMSRVILSPDTVKIKLIGDSITHGVGSSDFSESGEGFVRYEKTADGVTKTVTRRRNSGVKSWAAKFKARIEAGYNATVTNNAVRGWRTDEILRFWNQLIDGSEDIVIVMIGTNNRMNNGGQRSFYNDLQTMKFALEANGSDVIFMSALPASASNEAQDSIHFHMNDVDDVISKFAADNNREYISLYKKTLDYMEKTGAELGDLLEDGLHPNDRLHALMYGWILDGLGLNREHNPDIESPFYRIM